MNAIVFLIQCSDQKGLLAGITGFFSQREYNILHCQQYTDVLEGQYFMRLKLEDSQQLDRNELEQQFKDYSDSLGLNWSVRYSDQPYRMKY